MAVASFSQFGEDLLIARHLESERDNKGVIIDIGAYHPINWSNSFLFYLQGWRGINVDADWRAMKAFSSVRPEDLNLSFAVDTKTGTAHLTRFEEGAWNNTRISALDASAIPSPVIGVEEVECLHVNEFLSAYVAGKKIDLLNVDIEGADLDVIQALDVEAFRPKVIAAEISIDVWSSFPFQQFLGRVGYCVVASSGPTVILLDSSKSL